MGGSRTPGIRLAQASQTSSTSSSPPSDARARLGNRLMAELLVRDKEEAILDNPIVRALQRSANQRYIDEYNANTSDPEAQLSLDENGDIVTHSSGFIAMRAGDDELRTWLRARRDLFEPRTLEIMEALWERIQQDSFDIATGQAKAADVEFLKERIERNEALYEHLKNNVLPGEIERARRDIRSARMDQVERIEQIASITGRSFEAVAHNRPRGFWRSALDSAEEPFLVVGDAVRLAIDGKARPLSMYGQNIKIAADVYGLDPWEDLVPRQIAGSIPVLGQALGAHDMVSAISKGQFNRDMAGGLFGSTVSALALGKLTLSSGLVKWSGGAGGGGLIPSFLRRRLYDTLDEAAFAALSKYNPRSIRRNKEYGGLLYRDPNGRYGFSRAVKGEVDTVNPNQARIPRDARTVGDYHTHGDYGRPGVNWRGKPKRVRTTAELDEHSSDTFSQTDLSDSMMRSHPQGRIPGYKAYLGTPSGRFLRLDWKHLPFPEDPIPEIGFLDPQLFLGPR